MARPVLPPLPVLIDCDPGTDDALALFMALGDPLLDVKLVTVAGGNVGLHHTLRNARALVGLSGRAVPVVAGAERPLLGSFEDAAYAHGEDGLAGVVLPQGPAAAPGIAADAIRAALRAAGPSGLTLVGIGPATNLALALATEPALLANVAEIVLMSGAWGEGNVTPAAELPASPPTCRRRCGRTSIRRAHWCAATARCSAKVGAARRRAPSVRMPTASK